MIKSFLLIFLLIFAISGVCEFIYLLKMLFYFPNVRTNNYAFIVLKKGCAVKQLNYIWQKIKWQGNAFAVGIIAVTDNLENAEITKCDMFSEGKNIILCSMSTLPQSKQLQGDSLNGYR